MQLTSQSIFLFDTVEINSVSASFSYIQYDKNEYVEPAVDDIKRYVKIVVDTTEPVQTYNITGAVDIVSEKDLQAGFFSMTTVEENQWVESQNNYSENIRAGSFYDRYLRGINPNDNIDFDLQGDPIADQEAVVYDPTSGMPIIQKEKQSDQDSSCFLPESIAGYFGRNLLVNPLTEYQKIDSIQWKLDTIQVDSSNMRKKRIVKNGTTDTMYLSPMWENQGSQITINPSPDDGSIVGFVVQRFDESGNLAFSVFQNSSEFYDYSVLYGQTYTYVFYPVITISSILVMINNEAKVTIECKEVIPPEPPKDFRVNWKGGDRYLLTWRPNFREVVVADTNVVIEPGTVTGDVKGYQIFRRNELTEPYQLLAQISFNDVNNDQLREDIKAKVPKELLVDRESDNPAIPVPHPTFYEIELLSNRDHYVTMCALDARGQPSGYSSQYKIFRNSVTGEITQELVSQSGAPRNQPNLILKYPVIQDSFKVNGLTRCTLYFNPDLSANVPDIGNSIEIQLFDTKTDVYQAHQVTIASTS